MRIIYSRTKSPVPVRVGPEKRSFPILNSLLRNHDVIMVCNQLNDEEYYEINNLQKTFPKLSVHEAYSEKGVLGWATLGKQLKQLNADVVFYDDLNAYLMFKPILDIPYYINVHNIEHIRYDRIRRVLGNISVEFIHAIREREIRLFDKAEKILVCSLEDKQTCERLVGEGRTFVIPNVVDITQYSIRDPVTFSHTTTRLVFIGNFEYAPNIDAMTWFSTEIWPEISGNIKNIEFICAGYSPSEELTKLCESRGIVVKANVVNVNSFLDDCDIAVIPLRIGGGTRLKILEAMAKGLPVLSTRLGAEGLMLEDQTHVIFCETPEEFSRAIYDVINNIPLRNRLIKNGRLLVEKEYSYTTVERLVELYF